MLFTFIYSIQNLKYLNVFCFFGLAVGPLKLMANDGALRGRVCLKTALDV